jgi:hypothetical protein
MQFMSLKFVPHLPLKQKSDLKEYKNFKQGNESGSIL